VRPSNELAQFRPQDVKSSAVNLGFWLLPSWAYGPLGIFVFVVILCGFTAALTIVLIMFLGWLPLGLNPVVQNWRWFTRDELHIRDRRDGGERRRQQLPVLLERRSGHDRRLGAGRPLTAFSLP
jgi:hypothetical protein